MRARDWLTRSLVEIVAVGICAIVIMHGWPRVYGWRNDLKLVTKSRVVSVSIFDKSLEIEKAGRLSGQSFTKIKSLATGNAGQDDYLHRSFRQVGV
jgi:hypothetical protein